MRRSNLSPDLIVGFLFLGFLVLVGFGIYGVQRMGFLTPTVADTDYKVVGAALALFGVFATAIASIIAAVVKYSTDRLAEARQQEAEERLRQEAVVKALDLLEGRTGGESSVTRRNGALFTLSSMGQHDLALRLAGIMLPDGKVDPDTVAYVADKALEQGDKSIQAGTINMLETFADNRLITERGGSLPDCLYFHKAKLSAYTRERALVVLAKVLCACPCAEWRGQYWGEAKSIVGALAISWEKEWSNRRIKNDGAVILCRVFKAFYPGGPDSQHPTLFHPRKDINLRKLKGKLDKLQKRTAKTESAAEIAARLEEWASAPGILNPADHPAIIQY